MILILNGLCFLSACSFAPKDKHEPLPIPPHYKEESIWQPANPTLSTATKDAPWWALFHDETLNALEKKLSCNNHNLKIMFGRYQEALSIAQATRSALYPMIDSVDTIARQRNSSNFFNNNSPRLSYNTFLLSALLNYELDAWGRVRNAVVADDSLARASEFDVTAIGLSLHAELASVYFQLRGADKAQRVLDATVIAYQKALYLTKQRHQGGAVAIADVEEATTQLERAKTQATDIHLKRAQLEHAIAVLVGEIPANFKLPPTYERLHLIHITPELPSTLLERRPDIAAAEQRVHAANASIGVARAAFFPRFNLVGLIGLQSTQLKDLFSAKSIMWSLGQSNSLTLIQPEIEQVIFDGYKLQALLSKAKAVYFETVQTYQQTVLKAFQEVEDALIATRSLAKEQHTQSLATAAAKGALYQANRRYKGGLTTFLDVIIFENESLQAELALIDIQTRRQLASLQLIQALGGGWSLK